MIRHTPAFGWPKAAFACDLKRGPLRAANDNRAKATEADAVLAAALRLFAANGLATPQRAEDLALEALAAGDLAAHDRWAAVCGTFDRRRAARLLARRSGKGQGAAR